MSKIIAITNQKGGVGKTTTTINFGVALAKEGKRVLLIDADPQASLTVSMGIPQPDELNTTLSNILQRVVDDKEFDLYVGLCGPDARSRQLTGHTVFTQTVTR